MAKRALVLGAGGMDGSYLCEHLLSLGYTVHGLVRRSSVDNLWRIRHLLSVNRMPPLVIHYGDLLDQHSLEQAIAASDPELLFNEADQDHVGYSEEAPLYSMEVTALGVMRLLECCMRRFRGIKIFQPLSITMFGDTGGAPVDENTPFNPQSPYAVAKCAAYEMCRYYRNTKGMFISTAIMGNHDSPRRGEDYLLQKIARGAVKVARGEQNKLRLWNLSGTVDIGHSKEFMEAAHKIMGLEQPEDFCLATGRTHKIRPLASAALTIAGVEDGEHWPLLEQVKSERPSSPLTSCCEKARSAFGWDPKYDALEMVQLLTRHWMEQK